MRSQNEILEKIRQIQLSGVDPSGIQQKVLIHKLSWENAQSFLAPNDRTEEWRIYWKDRCRLDKEYLLKQLDEQLDFTYGLVGDKDAVGVLTSFQIIMCVVWLLGPKHDKFLRIFVPEILSCHKDFGRTALRKFCEEFGYRWKIYERRYLNEGEGLILPDDVFQKEKRGYDTRIQ